MGSMMKTLGRGGVSYGQVSSHRRDALARTSVWLCSLSLLRSRPSPWRHPAGMGSLVVLSMHMLAMCGIPPLGAAQCVLVLEFIAWCMSSTSC